MKKRLVILLTAALLITSMPFYAFADIEEPAASATEQTAPLPGEVKDVDGQLVYVDASGEADMTDGWKTASDGTYYVAGGAIVTKPARISVSTVKTKKTKLYYNKKKKKWQTKKIKKAKTKYKITEYTVTTNELYNFASDGKLITTKGLYMHDGNEYYGLGEGAVKTGWAAIGNSAMYFDKENGAMAKGTTVGYLKVPENGRLGKAYALGVKQLDKSGWTLKNAYKFSYKIKYQGRWYRAKNSETYAIKGFTKKKGNCYVMAATFYIQGKLLGYDIHQVHGKVGIWPHSWTVIKQDGKEWVYDPNFRNETGRNGWKIYYGKKGTWKYSKKKKMN